MAEQSSSSKGPIFGVVVAVVLVGVCIWAATRPATPRTPIHERGEGSRERAVAETPAPTEPAATEPADAEPEEEIDPTRWRHPSQEKLPLLAGKVARRAPRPLRFVSRYGKGRRTEDAARQRAESIRQRFLDGEDPYPLIRELSDPPIGIPAKMLKQWERLRPAEASPVIPLDDGFAVFFGTPEELPPSKQANDPEGE